MTTKLSQITTQYRKFNTNQVLTESQLNEFLDYFEDQDHLSRIGLSGVGIACGFKITYNNTLKTIKITQGYGVTTDGDLLTLQNPVQQNNNEKKSSALKSIELAHKIYTHYRVYDNDKVKYTPFFYADDKQIDIWELQPQAEIAEDDTTYSNLNKLANLNDKVVLLYLENYAKEGDLCTALTCDNQGIEQVAKLRVLLVSTENAKYIAGFDAIYNQHNWYKLHASLPKINAKRVILNCENTKTFKQLKQNYYDAIKGNITLTDLKQGYDVIFSKFNKPLISSAITTLFNFSNKAVPLDFQYRYDLFKDLIDTYNEIEKLLLHINVECCPSIGAFPKHLMLGKLVEAEDFKTLRHRFYKSPIIGIEDDNYKKVLRLIERASAIVYGYRYQNKGEDIKITPSQAHGTLEHKAIPFYYREAPPFLNHWSYEKTKNFAADTNLSYHRENLSTSLTIQDPLAYNIDHYNFYRIEGIQGKMYDDALTQVINKKKQYGLNFDVKMLSINASTKTIDVNDYQCEFEDLGMLLKAWTTEQECVLSSMSNFFSGFSTRDVGANVKETDYTQKRKANLEAGIAVADVEFAENPVKNRYQDYKNNVVEVNLAQEDYTIGKYMRTAIINNKGGSVNDIKNEAKALFREDIETDAWNEQPEVKAFITEDTVDLVAASYILSERIPYQIAQIDTAVIEDYELTLEDICNLVKRLKVTYQSVDFNDNIKQILALLITQLSSVCCSGEKLKILLAEIEKRKLEILLKIQLAEFVKHHPGLEHRAGVYVGGTFIMVYITENTQDQNTFQNVALELNFLQQPNIDDDGLDGDEGYIQLWDDRVSTRFAFLPRVGKHTQNALSEVVLIGDTLEDTVNNLADFLNLIWLRSGASKHCKAIANNKKLTIAIKDKSIPKNQYFIQFYNPAIVGNNRKIYFDENTVEVSNITTKNTVIADFCIPYICCSDCSPVNFIVQKEPITLSITDGICIDTTSETEIRVPFTNISPADAIIGFASTPPNGLAIDGTALVINPNTFTDFDTLIQFTANDTQTSAAITIRQEPEISIETSVDYNADKTRAIVVYKISGPGFTDNTLFNWNLAGGQNQLDRPDTDGNFPVEYQLPITPNNTISPSVTVSNGFCPKEIIIPEIEFDDPIEVNLKIVDRICIDTFTEIPLRIPFTNISPTNGTIGFENQPDGMQIDGTELVINPITFENYGETIPFTINNIATSAVIVAHKIPEIQIETDANYNAERTLATVTYRVLGDGFIDASEFLWKLGDGRTSTERPNANHKFIVEYELPVNSANTISPEVSIQNFDICPRDIIIPEIEFDEPIEFSLEIQDTVCIDTEITSEISVPFTTINPPNADIGFIGNQPNGMHIDDNQLFINPASFESYGEVIGFTINEVSTNAQITASKKLQFELIKQEVNYNWIEETLHHDYFFDIELQGDVNEDDVTYQWRINDVVQSTQKQFQPNLRINQGANTFNISASVTQTSSPCEPTVQATTVNIDFPNFQIRLPNHETSLCFNDTSPHIITVNPNIEGTVVNGLGVTKDANENTILRASDVSGNSTILSIAGQNLLTVNLTQAPTSSFDARIEEDELVLTNTSSVSDTYQWNFSDDSVSIPLRTKRLTERILIKNFQEKVIDIELTVSNACDSATSKESNFRLRDDDVVNKCIPDTIAEITETRTKLNEHQNLDNLNARVFVPTINIYDDVIKESSDFLKGAKNPDLRLMFFDLLNNTKVSIEEEAQNPDPTGFNLLTHFYDAQIQLFFNILHCQDHNILNTDESLINLALNLLEEQFGQLKNSDINYDENNSLKNYLSAYSKDATVIGFIKNFIIDNLLPNMP